LRQLFPHRSDFCRGFGEGIVVFLVFSDVEKEPRLFEVGTVLFPSIDNTLEG